VTFDPNKAANLSAVYDEALRTARNLLSSIERISRTLLPIEAVRMEKLSEDDKDRLDAFRVRFIELQDLLGAKVFRALLVLEEERAGSHLDTLNTMEKRGVIPSVARWVELRRLRNGLSHDYPATTAERTAALNEALKRAPELLAALDGVRRYCARLPLELPTLR
jgi:hypothetical protein